MAQWGRCKANAPEATGRAHRVHATSGHDRPHVRRASRPPGGGPGQCRSPKAREAVPVPPAAGRICSRGPGRGRGCARADPGSAGVINSRAGPSRRGPPGAGVPAAGLPPGGLFTPAEGGTGLF